jgi:uncharacterized phage protein (TIGR01671 family)
MRNIEFRGKAKCINNWSGFNGRCNVKDGCMVVGQFYFDVIDNEDSCSFLHSSYIRMPYGDHYADIEVDPETVGQFTGLLDKNGTKIFEGDILKIKYTSCTGVVHFYDPKEVRWIDESCGFNISHGIDCEVIGNIHEAKS